EGGAPARSPRQGTGRRPRHSCPGIGDGHARPAGAPAWKESMNKIKSVCVYCGSSAKVDERYREAAVRLGVLLARQGVTLVYGGGRVGLMGLMADACLQAGGAVV